MQWQSFSEFLSLGGHGFYVWTAWGAVALLIVGEVISQRLRRRRILARVRAAAAVGEYAEDGE